MDSRRLGYFVAVVDHGGFTAAAKAVFVSQPALSLAVRELETELGIPLFARIGRRVTLTAAGHRPSSDRLGRYCATSRPGTPRWPLSPV